MNIYLGKGVTVSVLLFHKACENLQVLYTWNLLVKVASLCGAWGLFLQQVSLLAENSALSCFSTRDKSVVRCYKCAGNKFCPAPGWGGSPES